MLSAYLDLAVAVGPRGVDGYPVTLRGPGGDARGTLAPLDTPEIRGLAGRLAELALGERELEDLGRALFEALFAPPLRDAYARAVGAMRPGQGLRLTLDIDAREAEVAALPWEYLRDPERGPLALLDAPVVRYLPHASPPQRLAAELPLRVLLTAAQTPPPAAVLRELEAVRATLAPLGDWVELTVEPHLTRPRLQALLRGGFHVWHFVGHGALGADGRGELVLEDDDGEGAPLPADALGLLLASSGVRLAVLDACEGAAVGLDPLRSVAPALIAAGVPAVVAMQFQVPEETTRAFAAELYRALAEGFPIDTCVTEGRRAVAGASGVGSPEWGVPVVYTRAPDGRLFDLPPLPKPPCPYPGMVPFRPEDARFFHGRAAEIDRMLQHLRGQSRLLVIGPSGSGKSSLIRAGLLPRLRESSLFPPGHWEVRDMRPGDRPLSRLAEALGVTEREAADPDAAAAAVAGLMAASAPPAPSGEAAPPRRLLLLLDQFEELFTLAAREEQLRFVAAFQALRQVGQVALLIGMRADFYPDLMSSALWPIDPGQRLEVAPLRGEALRAAIERPAADVGVRIESGLVDRLLADAADEPGALPLVQETMVLLWDRMPHRLLPLRAYADLGRDGRSGLAVAIATRAEATLAAMGAAEQAAARRTLLRLVQFGEGRSDTRRQQPLDALRADAADQPTFDAALRRMVDARLLTMTKDEGPPAGAGSPRAAAGRSAVVDISHEALIRGWPALQSWVAERRDAELTRRRLESKAAEWARLGRGVGGQLDEVELAEAERWLASPDAADLGSSALLPELVVASRATLASGAAAQDLARRRELEQARALAEEQRSRAEEQASARAKLQRSAALLRALLACACLAAALAALFGVQARSNAAQAESSARSAERERAEALRSAAEARDLAVVAAAQAALARGDTDQALALALAAASLPGPPPGAEVALSEAAYTPGTRRRITGHADRVWSVELSADGALALSAGEDGSARLWDVASGRELRRIDAGAGTLWSAALGPGAATALTASDDRTARVWDLERGRELRRLAGHEGAVYDVALSPDGGRAATGSADRTARVWDVASGRGLRRLAGHTGAVWNVAWSPDGRTLLSASDDTTLRLWDVASGRELRRLTGHTGAVYTATFSPDGRSAISGSLDTTLRVWDVASGRELRQLVGHTDLVLGAAFSPDGRLALSGSADGSVRVWDVASGRELRRLTGHTGTITGLAFGPDGRSAVSSSGDNTLRVWDLWPGAEIAALEHGAPVNGVAFGADGGTLLSAADDGAARLWDAASGREIGRLVGHEGATVYAAQMSPDGRFAVTSGRDRTLRVWDAASGRELRRLEGHTERVTALALGPNRWTVISASFDTTLRLWDLVSGREIRRFVGHTDPVMSVVLSADGALALSGGRDKTLRLWDVATGQELRRFSGHDGEVFAVALSADGTRALSGSSDGSVRLWDVATGQELRRLTGHTGTVYAAALSIDGRLAASGSADGTVRLWDVATGQELRRFRGNAGAVYAVAFRPDGRALLSGAHDGWVRLWRLDTLPELVAWAGGHRSAPELTREQRALYRLDAAEPGASAP